MQCDAGPLRGEMAANFCNKCHMAPVISQRNSMIFWGNKIQPDHAIICGDQLKCQQGLGIHLNG